MVSYGDTTDNVISLYTVPMVVICRDHILSASQMMITAYEISGEKKGIVY